MPGYLLPPPILPPPPPSPLRFLLPVFLVFALCYNYAYFQFFGGKSKARPAVDKVILLISDGKPKDMDLLQKVVKDLKEKQVRIVTVAIGSSYSYIQRFRYILRSIATGFKYAFKSEKDSLNKPSLIEDVAKEICETIKAPQTPKGKPKCKYETLGMCRKTI